MRQICRILYLKPYRAQMAGKICTQSSMNTWFETLPEQCPEKDAIQPNGSTFFRVVETENIKCKDFWSHRKIWPHKVFKTPECRARSVSIFQEATQCQRILLLPNNKEKKIAAITLPNSSGLIKKTGKEPGHYSWWRSNEFDPLEHASLYAVGV